MAKAHRKLLQQLKIGEWSFCRRLPDDQYLQLMYRINFGRRLNLRNPQAFTEKIQWLKLYWRDDNMTRCADKFEVRKFVEERIGPNMLKRMYGVYDQADAIDLDGLPNAFVLKVNHGCKQNIFCKNKSELDWNYSIDLLNQCMKANLYYQHREWAYKNIVPRIICEEYLAPNDEILYEYGFYCYSGVPRLVEINEDEGSVHRVNMFDLKMNLLESKYSDPSLHMPYVKPPQLDKLLEYATLLSEGFPFVRVDLLCVGQKIYFGEMTFYPLAGLCKINPDSFDYFLGAYLDLPTENTDF